MQRVIFVDSGRERSELLQSVFRELGATETHRLAASGPGWESVRLCYTFHEGVYAFRADDEALAERFAAALDACERSRTWQKRKTLDSLTLWRYENDDEESRGLIFYDRTVEGEWAWNQAQREENPPHLIGGTNKIDDKKQRDAWKRCTEVFRGEELSIRTCRDEKDFRVLCGTSSDDDPCASYVVSGLANPQALGRAVSRSYDDSDLHELVRLGQAAGWAYGWTWGGGYGEYHGILWAREPGLAQELSEQPGIRVAGRF